MKPNVAVKNWPRASAASETAPPLVQVRLRQYRACHRLTESWTHQASVDRQLRRTEQHRVPDGLAATMHCGATARLREMFQEVRDGI